MRTITDLLKHEGRVYVYSYSPETRDVFLENAQKEGFTFKDGALPTSRPLDTVYAINEDRTINFLGMWGTQAFQNPEYALYPVTRIDYQKYIKGFEKYLYEGESKV